MISFLLALILAASPCETVTLTRQHYQNLLNRQVVVTKTKHDTLTMIRDRMLPGTHTTTIQKSGNTWVAPVIALAAGVGIGAVLKSSHHDIRYVTIPCPSCNKDKDKGKCK